jgi:hypothetical protein
MPERPSRRTSTAEYSAWFGSRELINIPQLQRSVVQIQQVSANANGIIINEKIFFEKYGQVWCAVSLLSTMVRVWFCVCTMYVQLALLFSKLSLTNSSCSFFHTFRICFEKLNWAKLSARFQEAISEMSHFYADRTLPHAPRSLHWVHKIGNLKASLDFFENIIGLRVLRHEEFSTGCEATCNGPYGGRWCKTVLL